MAAFGDRFNPSQDRSESKLTHYPEDDLVYRKGELGKGTIDRNWPHQVALPAARCGGADYVTLFCDDEKLSLCVRGHSFRRGDVDMTVFCFADRAHAEQFYQRFGGEFVDPKNRPKWPGSKT